MRPQRRMALPWSLTALVGPFMVSGIGMAMFWAPVANVVLAAVRKEEEDQASGAQNAIRELGGVFGVAGLLLRRESGTSERRGYCRAPAS